MRTRSFRPSRILSRLVPPALAGLLLATGAILPALPGGQAGAPPPAGGGPASEPPERVRVRLADLGAVVPLGGAAELPDGRRLTVELLPTRRFEVPGEFAFEYPRAWRYLGAEAAPYGAWWHLSGDGAGMLLRRHEGDPEAVRAEYVASTAAGAGAGAVPRPDELTLDGRTLHGTAVEVTSPAVGAGYVEARWVQRVFAWRDPSGEAWLLVLMSALDPPAAATSPFVPVLVTPAGTTPAPGAAELEALCASFRWNAPTEGPPQRRQ